MTNAQIIYNAQFDLMEAGIIGTTGRTITYTDDAGTEHTMPEPEEIHTYAAWQLLGFQVRKGEKAKANFSIWKYKSGKKQATAQDDDSAEEPNDKMFLTKAYFFAASQVDKKQEG